jgi:hypothetical protein
MKSSRPDLEPSMCSINSRKPTIMEYSFSDVPNVCSLTDYGFTGLYPCPFLQVDLLFIPKSCFHNRKRKKNTKNRSFLYYRICLFLFVWATPVYSGKDRHRFGEI